MSGGELCCAIREFPLLEKQCEMFGVESGFVSAMKEKAKKRAQDSLSLCVKTRHDKLLSLMRLEKQPTSKPEIVAENMCLEFQELRQIFGKDEGKAEATVMKALALMNGLSSAEASAKSDIHRVQEMLSQAHDLIKTTPPDEDVEEVEVEASAKSDLQQGLGLSNEELEEVEAAIIRGQECATLVQQQDREKRMDKLAPCRLATDIESILQPIKLPESQTETATFRELMVPVSRKIITKQQKLLADIDSNTDMRDDMMQSRMEAVNLAKTHPEILSFGQHPQPNP